MTTDTPQSLLERLCQPETVPADWDRLVSVYAPLLRTWLARYPLQGADVDDLVQEVLAVLVRKLPQFQHNGRTGAFRVWLRSVLVHQVRWFYRRRDNLPEPVDPRDDRSALLQLEGSDNDLARRWDDEHDRHVVARLLNLIRPEFTPTTWQAFERSALQGLPAADVGTELGLSANAVCLARSRVLRRLREEARGLVDE
jgi:RNA polymerase sigma-70 factor (ECF subfamily)